MLWFLLLEFSVASVLIERLVPACYCDSVTNYVGNLVGLLVPGALLHGRFLPDICLVHHQVLFS